MVIHVYYCPSHRNLASFGNGSDLAIGPGRVAANTCIRDSTRPTGVFGSHAAAGFRGRA
jgi:hypothetical protein